MPNSFTVRQLVWPCIKRKNCSGHGPVPWVGVLKSNSLAQSWSILKMWSRSVASHPECRRMHSKVTQPPLLNATMTSFTEMDCFQLPWWRQSGDWAETPLLPWRGQCPADWLHSHSLTGYMHSGTCRMCTCPSADPLLCSTHSVPPVYRCHLCPSWTLSAISHSYFCYPHHLPPSTSSQLYYVATMDINLSGGVPSNEEQPLRLLVWNYLEARCPSVTQPTVSKHWRNVIIMINITASIQTHIKMC